MVKSWISAVNPPIRALRHRRLPCYDCSKGFTGRRYPRAVIVGHHDLDPQKACPCIENVAHEYADLQP